MLSQIQKRKRKKKKTEDHRDWGEGWERRNKVLMAEVSLGVTEIFLNVMLV